MKPPETTNAPADAEAFQDCVGGSLPISGYRLLHHADFVNTEPAQKSLCVPFPSRLRSSGHAPSVAVCQKKAARPPKQNQDPGSTAEPRSPGDKRKFGSTPRPGRRCGGCCSCICCAVIFGQRPGEAGGRLVHANRSFDFAKVAPSRLTLREVLFKVLRLYVNRTTV